jgi:hypothetical protein
MANATANSDLPVIATHCEPMTTDRKNTMSLKNYRMISTGILFGLIPAAALANFAVGDTVGTGIDEIRAKFESRGYTVTEIEVGDGEIEVEYVLDGQEFEVILAAGTGEVLEVELEDDDD